MDNVNAITTRSRYGLRLLVDLVREGSGKPVDLGSIAKRQSIPEVYLSKLAIPLKAAGIIRSERGAKGGYSLSLRPEEITVLAVVEALEGRSSLLECTANSDSCARAAYCATRPVWLGLDAVINDYLKSRTLAEVAGTVPDYSI